MDRQDWQNRFNAIVDDALKACNWSYDTLAAKIGVGASSIYRWKKGNGMPSALILDRLHFIAYNKHVGESH